jgi:hypothetical protein
MQPDSSPCGWSGSASWYWSTRPEGRAAAIAAPGPTADVQRTASASAPGWAPYGWSPFHRATSTSWSDRMAPPPLEFWIRTASTGQFDARCTAGSVRTAKLPEPSVSQPSAGQVGVCAEVTDSAPTAPCWASCHIVGVSTGFTSSQRSPAAPAMIT